MSGKSRVHKYFSTVHSTALRNSHPPAPTCYLFAGPDRACRHACRDTADARPRASAACAARVPLRDRPEQHVHASSSHYGRRAARDLPFLSHHLRGLPEVGHKPGGRAERE